MARTHGSWFPEVPRKEDAKVRFWNYLSVMRSPSMGFRGAQRPAAPGKRRFTAGSRTASGWRLITERPSLLEAGSPKSRCEQGCGPSEGSRQEFFLDTWLLVTLILWDVDFRQEKQNDRVWFTFYLGNSPGGRGSSKILQRDVCESYRRPWHPGVKRALEKVLMSQETNTHEIV
ncbi:uncharacterized protein [Ovis canadensis]|uniref:uncharacterized protein isoform X2 n=1 Tax=Ovis canadensis TaxID=37174 RepID=UPI0037509D09